MNSKQNATDNLFLRGHASLRKTRLTLPSILLMLAVVPLALTFLAVLWFGQLQLQRDIARQADQVGSELARQIASVVADPLAAEDTLSLNIVLAHWAQNPMIAHASLTGANNRVVAEAGRRPAAGSLAPGQGRFIAAVHVQDELIGQLHLSLARAPFASPAASLVEALLWCIVLLGVISGLIAWRYAVGVRRTLAGLGNWYGDTGQPAPGTGRIDEVGDLARRLAERRITDLPPEPEPEPEPEFDIEPEELDEHIASPDADPAPLDTPLADDEVTEDREQQEQEEREEHEAEQTAADLSDQLDQLQEPPLVPTPASTVVAVRLANMQSLHDLPRPRLLALLEQYREYLEQVSHSWEGTLHTLMDGTSLILFDPQHPDQLGAALCCGELLRVLGHELQLKIADTGISLQIQLALCHAPCQDIEPDQLPEQSTECADMLARMQHSRNLLLLDSTLADSGLLNDKAVLRRLASQPGSHCVERLLEPYRSQLEQQLKTLTRP